MEIIFFSVNVLKFSRAILLKIKANLNCISPPLNLSRWAPPPWPKSLRITGRQLFQKKILSSKAGGLLCEAREDSIFCPKTSCVRVEICLRHWSISAWIRARVWNWLKNIAREPGRSRDWGVEICSSERERIFVTSMSHTKTGIWQILKLRTCHSFSQTGSATPRV